MNKRLYHQYHIFFGLLDLVALVAAFILSLNVLSIYFSYFTVLSNILVTGVFLYFGFMRKKKVSRFVQMAYGPSVLYMTITGIVFWTILKNNHTLATIPWINLTLHGVMSIAVFVGWVLYPPSIKVRLSSALIWVLFPLLFVFYTLIRGPFAKWYPYPFLNPNLPGGYERVALYVVGILISSFLVSLLLMWIASLRRKKSLHF